MTSKTIAEFFYWWKSQLAGFLPKQFVSIFTKQTIFITYDGQHYSIFKPTKNTTVNPSNKPKFTFAKTITNDNFLDAIRHLKKQLAKNNIALILTDNSFYSRQSNLPTQALALGDKILQQDLKRLSPNGQTDLVAGWFYVKSNDTNAMVQLMAKKEIITHVANQLHSIGLSLFQCSAVVHNDKIAPVNFLKNWYEAPLSKFTILKKTTAYLCFSTVFLSFLLVWQFFDHQNNAINQLEQNLINYKSQANAVLSQIKDINQKKDISSSLLALKTSSESAVTIWEEMSKTFPDSVWLLQFTVSGNKVKISGFAKTAAELIERIEASSSFHNAAFLSPVIAGVGNGLERFTITFKLSNQSLHLTGEQ